MGRPLLRRAGIGVRGVDKKIIDFFQFFFDFLDHFSWLAETAIRKSKGKSWLARKLQFEKPKVNRDLSKSSTRKSKGNRDSTKLEIRKSKGKSWLGKTGNSWSQRTPLVLRGRACNREDDFVTCSTFRYQANWLADDSLTWRQLRSRKTSSKFDRRWFRRGPW